MSSIHAAPVTGLLNFRRWLMSITVCLVCAGCQTLPAFVPCPLPTVEQATKVQEIVPIGTPRDDALAKLKQAGIEGSFGTSKSIFYCNTWQQDDKERWHINVDLLFDDRGELYGFRPDPQDRAATASDQPGTAKVTKKPKEVASAKQTGIVDPFAE